MEESKNRVNKAYWFYKSHTEIMSMNLFKRMFTTKYVFERILVVFGLVLIWRGVWYVLDEVDKILFGGSHILTSVLGIILGLFILYIPDKDLKEIEKL